MAILHVCTWWPKAFDSLRTLSPAGSFSVSNVVQCLLLPRAYKPLPEELHATSVKRRMEGVPMVVIAHPVVPHPRTDRLTHALMPILSTVLIMEETFHRLGVKTTPSGEAT